MSLKNLNPSSGISVVGRKEEKRVIFFFLTLFIYLFIYLFIFLKFLLDFIYLFIYFWLCWVFGSCEGFL